MGKFSESSENLMNVIFLADNLVVLVLHDLEHLLSYKDASKIHPSKLLASLPSHGQLNMQVTPTHSTKGIVTSTPISKIIRGGT